MGKSGFFKDFKAFITKGNIIDMAVGVIIGGAFGIIVSSLVADIIMPLISPAMSKTDFTEIVWTLREATADSEAAIMNGRTFIQAVIDFPIIAPCIFIALRVAQGHTESRCAVAQGEGGGRGRRAARTHARAGERRYAQGNPQPAERNKGTEKMNMFGYIIGADGGGSKTAMLLARTDGSEIARLTAGASNPTDLGIENSASFLTETAARLCAENGVAPGQVRAVFLGVAGGSHKGFCALTNDKLRGLFPNAKTAVSHDAVNIVYAAFPDEDGAAVICGTGCSCYVRKGDVLHRIGGYSIFDVSGNGYEIGKRAVSHALACVDGRAEPDALYALVRDYTGEDLLDALPRLLRCSKTEIARYAPLVFEAERRGSAAAGGILRENIARIAEYINAAARYFDASFPAAIAGGIFRDARAMELLLPMLRCDCRVSVLTREPVCGAAEKARRLLTNG